MGKDTAISWTPALGLIDWSDKLDGIDLVIFGDESGRSRRPAEIEWARQTRDACALAGVTFHFKQFNDGKRTVSLPLLDGRQHAEMPAGSP